MKYLYIFLLLISPYLAISQANYTSVSYSNPGVSDFSKALYIGDGRAAVINDGEVYEINIDDNFDYNIKYIENSAISLDNMASYDANQDGTRDLLTWDTSTKGIYTYLSTPNGFDDNGKFYSNSISSFAYQDFDDDGVDELLINGYIYKHKSDGTLELWYKKSPSNNYVYKSPYMMDLDQDGDKDIIFNLVTNIGYLENNGNERLNQKLISQFNHSCKWLQVIKTNVGPIIIFFDSNEQNLKRIIPESGVFKTKVLLSHLPNSGYSPFVCDINEDGNEEILMYTKWLNHLVILKYDSQLDTLISTTQPFTGSKSMFIIDDRGRSKIVGINPTDINVYEFDDNLKLNLIKNSIRYMAISDNSFIDFDGDSYVDMINNSLQRRYFGIDNFGNINKITLPGVGGKLLDFDGDGDADYVKKETWYENVGNGIFSDAKQNPAYNPYPDPQIFFTRIVFESDLDDDGDIDLLSYNYFGEPLLLYENVNNDHFLEGIEIANNGIISGDLKTIKYLDLNNDGKKDILMVAASGMVWFPQVDNLLFDRGHILYEGSFRIQNIDVKDGNFDGIPDIVIGSGKLSAGSAFGETVLFRGTESGPVLEKVLESDSGYKNVSFINSDDIGALDVLVSSNHLLYIYKLNSYDNITQIFQPIKSDFNKYGSFLVMDVDGDDDSDIIIYKDGDITVEYLLKNEDGIVSSCPPNEIILRSQKQVDRFGQRYGSCKVIDGELRLGPSVDWADISDLNPLINIKEIKGNLYFDLINGISDYKGFSNLEKIGGSLVVNGHKLSHFKGFENLQTIGGDILLTNAFTASGSGNFSDFNNLDSLGGGIILRWSNVTDIDDLVFSNKINGDLHIERCSSLTNLDCLSKVDSVLGNITITQGLLTDLSSMSNLKYFEGLNLSSLSQCSKFSIYPEMDSVKNDFVISLNHPNLNFHQINHIKHIGGRFRISGSDLGNWDDLEYVGKTFIVYSDEIDETSFNKLSEVGDDYKFTDPKVLDYNNFSNLEKIGGYFSVNGYANSLTGLENLDSIKGFCFFNGSNITDISGFDKDIYIGGNWQLNYNSQLSICDVPSLCNHIKSGREVTFRDNAIGCNDISEIKCLEHSISGKTFYDYNENGLLDSTDASLANITLYFDDDNDSLLTANNGFYRKFLLEGDKFSVTAKPKADWKFTTENEYTIDSFIPFVSGLDNFNFGFKPENEKKEFFTSITSGLFICNRDFDLNIFARNEGTKKSTGFIKIRYNDKLTLHPDFTEFTSHDAKTQEIIIDFENIYPYFTLDKNLIFIAPGTSEIENENLFVNVEIHEINEFQETEKVHQDQILLNLLCSFDPNDKLVTSTDQTGNLRINEDDELKYTIRFQNTGNYFAEDIRITDEISEDLDISTFEFINSSHDVKIVIKERIVTFLFEDIFLIDSTSNFIESQGFVTFKIKPLINTLDLEFLNEANIFFDFNEPILTNEVNSLIYDPTIGTNYISINNLKVYPQPATDIINIEIEHSESQWDYLILNPIGQKVKHGILNKKGAIDTKLLNSGLYHIILSDGEKVIKSKISIINMD